MNVLNTTGTKTYYYFKYIMRAFITVLLLTVFSIHSWSQIKFNLVRTTLPGAKTSSKAVAIGDIDNDGLNDLVVGSDFYFDPVYDYNIFIYKQNKNGTLNTPYMFRYPTCYPGLKVLQIADVNNDKLNDILIGYGDSIGIFYQKSPGIFGKIKSIYSGTDVDGLKTGDLNNDGLTDIAVSHWNAPFVKVFTQNTNGSLTAKSFTVMNAGYDEIDVADMNGDHLDDIVFMPGQFIHSTLQILYQKPDIGIAGPAYVYKYPQGYYPTFRGIGIGDLNNDGRNDIVGSYLGDSFSMVLMLQNNNGSIVDNILTVPAYMNAYPVEIADLNCDGNNEIIVGHNGWGSVTVYEKNAQQQYSNYSEFKASYYYYPYSMAVGDINNDNLKDIVSADDFSQVSILYNTSKPKAFDKIESSAIKNLSTSTDTTTIETSFTTPIADPSPVCKINRDLHRTIIKKVKNERITGDSIIIRKSTTCGCTDTISRQFSYSISNDLSTDTIDTIINKDNLDVSSINLIIDAANGSTSNLSINANICWDLISDQDWLTPSSNTGYGDTPIGLTATANPSVKERTATLTLTGLGMLPINVNVTQSGFIPLLTASPSSIIINDKINNASNFTVSSNVNWKISLDTTWLSVDKNNGEGNDLVSINALPNNTNADRIGTITITGADTIVRTIQIVQQLNTDLTPINTTELSVFPNPAQDKLTFLFTNYSFEGLVEIYDVKGIKLSAQYIIKGLEEISIEDLVSGMYFLKFHLPKEYIVQKFIKM